ncbi:hypothetical protein QX51_15295 [Terrisporobacter othiniensis]|uniref:Uncharacterized protein n=2 Tax=Terrisporobacter othiniensis TaxID=1577792 RepID=A0A0B3VU28_9FIRM|nr:hypothetical protein QX51_15295 [Terrisporobacter othiniensis]
MIVLMKLLSKTSEYVVYLYGKDEDDLDGQIKLSLKDPSKYEILKESKIGKIGTLRAISKLQKAIKNNDIKEKISYQS